MSQPDSSDRPDRPGRRAIVTAIAVQLLFTVLPFVLLRRTPDERLRGPRWLWRVVIPASVVQIKGSEVILAPIGPVLFLLFGRRRSR